MNDRTNERTDRSADDWHDAYLGQALAEHFGDAPPTDLTARILTRSRAADAATPRETPAPQARPSRRRHFATAAIVLLAIAVVVAVRMTSTPPSATQDPPTWLPLAPGATWIYQVRQGDRQVRIGWSVIAGVPFRLQDDEPVRTVWQVRIQGNSDGVAFRYLACDEHGVWRYANAIALDHPGLLSGTAPTRLLATPVGIEARWHTEEREPRWQTSGGELPGLIELPVESDDDPSRAPMPVRADLVAVSERVTVPAGAFDAVHVRLRRQDDEEHLWFAAGTGIVQRELHRDGKVVARAQLAVYAAGHADPDPAIVLEQELDRRGIDADPEWLELHSQLLLARSRFAIVEAAPGKRIAFRVCGDRAAPFDPEAIADLQQWVIDDGWIDWPAGELRYVHAQTLATTAGRIELSRRGLTFQGTPKKVASFAAGELGVEMSVLGEAQDGATTQLQASVFVNGGKVTRSVIQ